MGTYEVFAFARGATRLCPGQSLRGGRSMRVRITRADSATDVLVLGGAGD